MHEEIERENLGWCCKHESGAVRAALLHACRHTEVLDGMGARARKLLERKYERRLCTRQWAELLSRVLKSEKVREPTHA